MFKKIFVMYTNQLTVLIDGYINVIGLDAYFQKTLFGGMLIQTIGRDVITDVPYCKWQ